MPQVKTSVEIFLKSESLKISITSLIENPLNKPGENHSHV